MLDRPRPIRTLLSFGFLTLSAAFYASACGPAETEPPASTGGVDTACVPSSAAGPIASTCGVFASSSAGSDDNTGAKDKPVQTLAKAISLAKSKNQPVYACAEAFAEALEVPEGVTIFGGLDCTAPEWAYVGATSKTTISPEADKVPLTIVAGQGTARFEDITARAADAMAPSGSSIAAIVDKADVELVRCELVAGAGATGEAGLQPTDDVGPADPSDLAVRGNDGSNACMGGTSGNVGGEPKVNEKCTTSIGGRGGTGQELNGEDGEDGVPLPDPNPNNFGVGGIGSMALNSCQSGQSGASGTEGLPGAGAQDLGTIDAKGFIGGVGQQGTPGTPGQGGGGGGAAKGKLNCHGASGGSGGAGGCGGSGGLGGKGGGSSFAVLSVDGTIKFTATALTAGAGGKGGDGGSGQAGGVGGNGGNGGGPGPQVSPACGGGLGGQGGTGGTGGGGRGGHSAAIAYKGKAPSLDGATPTIGAAGLGGGGPDMASTGAEGVASDVIEFK
jgi:hypothetical protein